jgi:Pyruvate/2-oxoacid:ferredoxin oxidoreductase delta subunit
MGLNTHLFSYPQYLKGPLPDLEGRTLIGICSATHGFNLPHSVLKIIFKFHHYKGSDFFLLNTRAGMKLSKLFLPGLSGLAQIFPCLVMRLKGYPVVAMRPVDLPSNWISLHPGLKPKVVNSMEDHYESKVKKFAGGLLSGKRTYLPAFVSLPFDLLVTPLAIGYYFIGRFILAKTFFASDRCNDCLLCIGACPTKSIILKDNRPFWKLTCESCMHCMNFCPQRAVEVSHNTFIPLMWLLIAIINPFVNKILLQFLETRIPEIKFLSSTLLTVVRWVVAILLFTGSYYLVHYLMHFRPVWRFMSWFTITRFAFWRRYRIPKSA